MRIALQVIVFVVVLAAGATNRLGFNGMGPQPLPPPPGPGVVL